LEEGYDKQAVVEYFEDVLSDDGQFLLSFD